MPIEVRFRPLRGTPPGGSPGERSLLVSPGTTLLEAARQAGLPVASACGADGVCGRCGMRVLKGAASLSPETEFEAIVKEAQRVDAELRLACRAEISGPVEVTASYW